jgi:hypothetical protein
MADTPNKARPANRSQVEPVWKIQHTVLPRDGLIIRLEDQQDGTCRVLTSTPYGNMEWGVGIDFPSHEAALAVALAIQENVGRPARIDG